MIHLHRYALAVVLALAAGSPVLRAQPIQAASSSRPNYAELDKSNLEAFERRAALAQKLGATHLIITEQLPPATWQFVPADDPYPAWYIQRPDFLKLFPPHEVEPYVDMAYARRVVAILEARSKILKKYGLKGHWSSNIPQVMPEAFFTAYPQLRGPRVDQPNRARVARFSMTVEEPETVRFYQESLKSLLEHCPEIETFAFLTQDSGSGFDWVPALYPGLNGNSNVKDHPLSARVANFLIALQSAAKSSGHEIEIVLNPIEARQWMLPSFSPEQVDAIVARLPRGIALQGKEGPDGRPFHGIGFSHSYRAGAFYPVVGLLIPDFGGLPAPPSAKASDTKVAKPAKRLLRISDDESLQGFEVRLQQNVYDKSSPGRAERLSALRAFAVQEVGEAQADKLIEAWSLMHEAEGQLDALNFGSMLQFGHVLNRWIVRPPVPLPKKLTAEEKSYYRPYIFQAKGEDQANDLIDIQAMRMYEGYGAHLLFQRVTETTVPKVERAMHYVHELRDSATDDKAKQRWDLMAKRLQATIYLLRSADNLVSYQAQLDRVNSLGVKPEPNPVLGTQSSWDRTDLMEIARREMDNTVNLMRLLQSTKEPILDLAPVKEEETIMRLGPDLVAQLKRKIDTINAHWTDYDELFTVPNP